MQVLRTIKHVLAGDWFAISFVSYQGLRLPPPRNRFCTDDWKDDAFYLTSAKQEVERLHHVRFERAHFDRMIDAAGLRATQFYYHSEAVTKQSAYLVTKPGGSSSGRGHA